MARALGWRFLDRNGRAIECWTELRKLVRLEKPERLGLCDNVVVAVDVSNPLLGPEGASRIYGPQKGLRASDFRRAESCLGRLGEVASDAVGQDYAKRPGAGAAGGLGFGLSVFAGALLEPGFDLFATHAQLERKLHWADVVITGEGSIDRSTLMGKGDGRLASRCRRLGVPCLGLAGVVGVDAQTSRAFSMVRALTDVTSAEDATARPARWLRRQAAALARDFADLRLVRAHGDSTL
jgi:glycerate kinase